MLGILPRLDSPKERQLLRWCLCIAEISCYVTLRLLCMPDQIERSYDVPLLALVSKVVVCAYLRT